MFPNCFPRFIKHLTFNAPAYYPLCHTFHMLLISTLAIFGFLVFSCPYLHSNPPTDFCSHRFLFSPSPPASVCQCLDSLPFSYITNPNSSILAPFSHTDVPEQ